MSYPYSIIRNGYIIPLTSVFSSYNSSGITNGFQNMGSFSTTNATYNKQNQIGFYYKGLNIFQNNMCYFYTPPSINTVYNWVIPNGVSNISVFLIGGGGGSRGYDNINGITGSSGGGGGFLFLNCNVSAGMSYYIYSGSSGLKGSDTPFQGDGTVGNSSFITLNGNSFLAYAGQGGYDNGSGGAGGLGGSYFIPVLSGLTLNYSYGGNGANGLPPDNFANSLNGLQQNFSSFPVGFFDGLYFNYGQGGSNSGGSNGIAIIYFHY